jgi:uncharacterized protein
MNRPLHQLIRTFLSAMASRDRDTLQQILAEDVVWHTPPSTMPDFRGPHIGRAAAIALVTEAGGSLFVDGTQRIEPLNLVAEDDQVAAQFRMTARTLSGFAYDNQYAFFFRCSGGHIAEIWENVDTAYVYGVLGIEPTWVRAE